MAPKLISFFLTLAINVTAGVVLFFGLLLAMNGYSESDATYGIVAYVVLALAVTLLMGGLAAVLTRLLQKRGFRAWSAVMISVLIFAFAGAILKFVSSLIAVGIAEYVRVNF